MLPKVKTDAEILVDAPDGISEATKASFIAEERRQEKSDNFVKTAASAGLKLDPKKDWGDRKSVSSAIKPDYGTNPISRVLQPFGIGGTEALLNAGLATVRDAWDDWYTTNVSPWASGVPTNRADKPVNMTTARISPQSVDVIPKPGAAFFDKIEHNGFMDWLASVRTVTNNASSAVTIGLPIVGVGLAINAWNNRQIGRNVKDANAKLDSLLNKQPGGSANLGSTISDPDSGIDPIPSAPITTVPKDILPNSLKPEITDVLPVGSVPESVKPLTWADIEAAFAKGAASGAGRVIVERVVEPGPIGSPYRPSDALSGGGAAQSRNRVPLRKRKLKRQSKPSIKRETPSDHKMDKITSRAGHASQEMTEPVGKERSK